jgi:hypothetical protein
MRGGFHRTSRHGQRDRAGGGRDGDKQPSQKNKFKPKGGEGQRHHQPARQIMKESVGGDGSQSAVYVGRGRDAHKVHKYAYGGGAEEDHYALKQGPTNDQGGGGR